MKNIHLLPTDKPSRLHLWTDENGSKLALCDLEFSHTRNTQNIYITSDEVIRVEDWFLWKDTEDPYLFKCIGLTDTDSLQVENSLTKKIGTYNRDPKDSDYGDWYRCYSKKIILTTDPDLIKDGVQAIDDDFLEWFVKNPSCEGVDVYNDKSVGYEYDHYAIIIPQEEPKQQTAVEWLFIKLYETIEMKGDGKVMDALLKEAKEIYKQQIIDATTRENVRCTEIANTTLKILGLEPVFMEDDTWGKHYYNNTFEK